MKTLLLILIALPLSCFVYGQSKLPFGNETLPLGAMSVDDFIRLNVQPSKRYDTVKVLMLCTDTSNRIYSFHSYGYSVREIRNEAEHYVDWYFNHTSPPKYYYVHEKYIDINKKPLTKNIIVWQSIIIGQ